MKVHVLQHVSFEGLGSIEQWLAARAAEVAWTRFYEMGEAAALPDLASAGLDLIIAMGGPMSVNDELELPWLIGEKVFIRQAIEQQIPVLGICLGAQLIASALGSRVYPGPAREIGWFEIQAARSAGTGEEVFQFPDVATVFHWHGETFDLPAGAVRLAKSEVCGNQAFQIGSRAIGLQFHLETTPETAQAMVTHCGHELSVVERYVQSAPEMLAVPDAAYRRINELMFAVLDYLTR